MPEADRLIADRLIWEVVRAEGRTVWVRRQVGVLDFRIKVQWDGVELKAGDRVVTDTAHNVITYARAVLGKPTSETP